MAASERSSGGNPRILFLQELSVSRRHPDLPCHEIENRRLSGIRSEGHASGRYVPLPPGPREA
jgi:hypothetical protein